MAGKSRGPYGLRWSPAVVARIKKLADDGHGIEAIREDLAKGKEPYPRDRSAILRVIQHARPQDAPPAGEGESADYRAPWRMLDASPDEVAAVLPVIRALLELGGPERRDGVRPSIAEARAIHRLRAASPDMQPLETWQVARELVARDLIAARQGNESILLDAQRSVALELWRDPHAALAAFREGMVDRVKLPGASIERGE